ncbi:MAG: hypothetical protein SPF70_01210 [Lachnospiraceae bacterium]|nr:hypothetical protein [Lachnospiraceae bacterium]
MRQTETQRNWNRYYGNPQANHKTPILIILFVLAIILSISGYYYYKITSNGTDMEYNDLTELVAECSTESSNHYSIGFAYNKNGSTMNESLKTIESYIDKCLYCNNSEIDEMISNVNNIDLSAEYNNYKEEVVKKLTAMKNYHTTYDDNYLEEFNNSNYMKELQIAFKLANVRYKLENDNTIVYWYYPDPEPFKD